MRESQSSDERYIYNVSGGSRTDARTLAEDGKTLTEARLLAEDGKTLEGSA